MNIPRYERNIYFEKLVALKADHDPNRIIADDGWTPDTSALDVEPEKVAHATIHSERLVNGLYRVVENEEAQKQTDEWYRRPHI